MNIVQRLLLVVLLAAIPLGVLQWLTVRHEERKERNEVFLVALRTANRAAAEQRRIIEGARQLLSALAQLPAVQDGDAPHCSLILRRLHSQFRIYTAIGVADIRGRIWCSSVQPGTIVSDRPFFKQAIATGKFTTGGYVVGRVTGARTLNFSLPVADSRGRVSGVLTAGLDLDRLAADLGRTSLPEESRLAIVGPDRRVLVDLPGGTNVGGVLPRHLEPAFEARTPGTMATRWLDGSDRLMAFVPPHADPDMPFFIAVGTDRAKAMAAIQDRAYFALGILMITVVAALLLAWWFATRFVRRPVARLAATVGAWREGNTSARVGRLDRGSEFDDLARAFDEIADAVVERERLLRDALESTTDSVIMLDRNWKVIFLNERALDRIRDYDPMGRSLWDVFPEARGDRVGLALQAAMDNARPVTITFEYKPLGGHFETNAFPAMIGGLALFIREVTEQHRAQERLRYLALNDSLTGLPNRASAMEIAQENAESGVLSAIVLLDLDNFKDVNDRLGHPSGDDVLCEVAERLRHVLGKDGTIARLGGDEFIAVLRDTPDDQSIELGRKLLRSLETKPFVVRGRALGVTASGGVALFDRAGGVNVGELLANADLALYGAKEFGGGTCKTYSSADRDAYDAKRLLEDEVAEAAARGEFELHFQAQVRLSDGVPVGAEALLRWRHPRRGLLRPDAFIDVLEASRHALSVGSWIIDEACRQAAFWWVCGTRLRVSANLFAEQLTAGDLPDLVQRTLARHNLPPEALELELTENIASLAEGGVREALVDLRRMGIRLAFDDFGTGFASLRTLKDFPVDRLKIDRGFVAKLPRDEQSQAIVEAILALARTLDLDVVAEGVETAEQEEYLRSRGCHEAQGFPYGKAMPTAEFRSHIIRML